MTTRARSGAEPMGTTKALALTGALMLGIGAPAAAGSDPQQSQGRRQSTPLVLQPNDGEPRLRRPPPASLSNLGAPFLFKVDPTPTNGGSRDFVVFTENVPVGATISPHRHPNSEELLYIHSGYGRAWLNGKEAKLQPGTIIYMPRMAGVKLINDGTEPIALVAIFSRPGFDRYQRDISVPVGHVAKPLTVKDLRAIRARHGDAVIYDQR